MSKISVLTPTIRKDGLEIIRKALEFQTFSDFEWIICSPFNPEISTARWIKDDFTGGFWTLNRAYNKLFKEAKGELIVSWQDWIWAGPTILDKFYINWKDSGGIISGVGDQYARMGEYRPEVKIWSDPRKTKKYGNFYECVWNDCEWNLAAFSKRDIEEIGGMDEQLDFLGVGGDQLQVCERWNDKGKSFYLDQTCESFTIRHSRDDFGGEKKWNKNHVVLNGKYDKRKQELKNKGQWPTLDYLP